MKKMYRRGLCTFVLPAIICIVLVLVGNNYLRDGQMWASSVYNRTVFIDGHIANGHVYDRNNLLLTSVIDGEITYSADSVIRISTVHAIGDRGHNIITGAFLVHDDKFVVYDPVNGVQGSMRGDGKVVLSIDANLNVAAYKALNGSNGVVAVCNYQTGELLCMVSTPSFDPSNNGFLAEDADGVYINRFISGLYPPGSVFKLVTAAAAIELIPDVYDFEYQCLGECQIGGNKITCVRKHGLLTIEDALADSCNCYFAQLSLRLGAASIGEYAVKYGLTESVYIDGVASACGSFDSQTYDSTKTAWASVGQADDIVNPAAVLRFISAIANGGKAPVFTTLLGANAQCVELIAPDTAEKLAVMMNYAAYKTYGPENYPGLELYAKSGTAEVGGNEKPHAWFVGYITNSNAPYAFVVLVENGGWGSVTAGRVANTVLQTAVTAAQ